MELGIPPDTEDDFLRAILSPTNEHRVPFYRRCKSMEIKMRRFYGHAFASIELYAA